MKIKDSALVAAAKLSNRYITDRFLPDKAIDLMDEATSRIAMELQSVPSEIDEVQRRLVQLELAGRQLAEETEEHAKDRLAEIEKESTELRRKLASLREQWEAEKSGVGSVQELRQQLDQVEHEFERAGLQIKDRQSSRTAGRGVALPAALRTGCERKALAAKLNPRVPKRTPRRRQERPARGFCGGKSAPTRSRRS